MDKNYPQKAPVSSTPYPTSYFKEVDLKGQAPPPRLTSPVVKSEPPVWFTISKYYLLVVNGLAFGASALSVGIAALVGFVFLFNEPAFGIGILVATAILSLLPFYFWHVPIKGASKEISTRLIIHGVIGVLLLSNVFVGTPQFEKPRSQQEAQVQAFVRASTTPGMRLSRFTYGIIEVVASFGMAHLIRQREIHNHIGMA